jgi:hypothetical protein
MRPFKSQSITASGVRSKWMRSFCAARSSLCCALRRSLLSSRSAAFASFRRVRSATSSEDNDSRARRVLSDSTSALCTRSWTYGSIVASTRIIPERNIWLRSPDMPSVTASGTSPKNAMILYA